MKKITMLAGLQGKTTGHPFVFDPYIDMVLYDENYEVWDGSKEMLFVHMELRFADGMSVVIHADEEAIVSGEYDSIDVIEYHPLFAPEDIQTTLKSVAFQLLECFSYKINNPLSNR